MTAVTVNIHTSSSVHYHVYERGELLVKKIKDFNLYLAIAFFIRVLFGWLFPVIWPPSDLSMHWRKELIALVIHGLILSICVIIEIAIPWRRDQLDRKAEGRSGLDLERIHRRNDQMLKWGVGVISVGLLVWFIISIICS